MCGKTKDISHFYKHTKAKSGHFSDCKECFAEIRKKTSTNTQKENDSIDLARERIGMSLNRGKTYEEYLQEAKNRNQ